MKDTVLRDTNADKRFMFVHLDGPHMTRDVAIEFIWFGARAASGCRFVFRDDYPKYNMQLISDALKPLGFKVLEQGKNKNMFREDAIYLAGLFDGEGCVQFHRRYRRVRKRKNPHYALTCTLDIHEQTNQL